MIEPSPTLHEEEDVQTKSNEQIYSELPQVFRNRIDRFRRNNPDFVASFERLELMICFEAVRLAQVLKTAAAVEGFVEMPLWKQLNMANLPATDRHLGYMGNFLGMVTRLAYLYLADEKQVEKAQGSLSIAIGPGKSVIGKTQ